MQKDSAQNIGIHEEKTSLLKTSNLYYSKKMTTTNIFTKNRYGHGYTIFYNKTIQ